uniref:Putative molecular chaperone prefoldin subunit 1 n=1 Tax=Tabanus bromius TaxID=304241 RepID=A0A0K8TNR2_TABBR
MAAMDLELKKAFTEMQINKIETAKKLKMLDMQTDVFKNSKQKYSITEREISTYDDSTRIYSSIGRMFVLSNVDEMQKELKSKQDKCETLITQLEEKKKFLVKNLQEQEDSLRELVQQKKADSKQ